MAKKKNNKTKSMKKDSGIKSAREKMIGQHIGCLLYTSPSPRDLSTSRMPSSA